MRRERRSKSKQEQEEVDGGQQRRQNTSRLAPREGGLERGREGRRGQSQRLSEGTSWGNNYLKPFWFVCCCCCLQALQEKQAQSFGDLRGSGTQAVLSHMLSAAPQLQRVAAVTLPPCAHHLLRTCCRVWRVCVRARAIEGEAHASFTALAATQGSATLV